MASFYDRLRAQSEKRVEAQKSIHPSLTTAVYSHYPIQQNSITALFANLYGSNQPAGLNDPRDGMDAYRQIYKNIPQFADVVKRKRDLIGNPIIEHTDSVWAKDMNQWLESIKSIGEVDNPFGYEYGINSVIERICKSTFVDGNAFTSFLDQDGMPIRVGKKMDCIRVHDSYRFRYYGIDEDRFELRYSKRGKEIILGKADTIYMKSLKFEPTQWLWGKPLAYHSEFVIRLFLVSAGAREQSNARSGAPLELTMFSFDTPNALDPASTMLMTEESQAQAQRAADAYSQAVANRHTKLNQGVDVIGISPSSMKVSSHVYGQGVPSPVNYQVEVVLYLQWAASSWGYPLALIGMDSGGDGLGSQKYAYAASTANLAAGTSQLYLSQNLIKPLIDRKMFEMKREAPKGYKIVWDGQTLEDQRNQTEIKKMSMETAKIQMEAYEKALMILSPDEQDQFRKEIGMK